MVPQRLVQRRLKPGSKHAFRKPQARDSRKNDRIVAIPGRQIDEHFIAEPFRNIETGKIWRQGRRLARIVVRIEQGGRTGELCVAIIDLWKALELKIAKRRKRGIDRINHLWFRPQRLGDVGKPRRVARQFRRRERETGPDCGTRDPHRPRRKNGHRRLLPKNKGGVFLLKYVLPSQHLLKNQIGGKKAIVAKPVAVSRASALSAFPSQGLEVAQRWCFANALNEWSDFVGVLQMHEYRADTGEACARKRGRCENSVLRYVLDRHQFPKPAAHGVFSTPESHDAAIAQKGVGCWMFTERTIRDRNLNSCSSSSSAASTSDWGQRSV